MLEGQVEDQATTTRAAWNAKSSHSRRRQGAPGNRNKRSPRRPHAGLRMRISRRAAQRRLTGCSRRRCLRNAANKPVSVRPFTAIDVTAQKQAQADKEHLEGATAAIAENGSVGTLAGGSAHDFSNILGAILGYGELAQEHSVHDSALRRYVDNVMHAAGRAKVLRRSHSPDSAAAGWVSAHMCMSIGRRRSHRSSSRLLPANAYAWKKLDAGDAALIGDSTHLHQVAMNLCTNAIHAMERGGTLTLSPSAARTHSIDRDRSRFRAALSPRDVRQASSKGYGRRHCTRSARANIRSVLYHQKM